MKQRDCYDMTLQRKAVQVSVHTILGFQCLHRRAHTG